MMAAAVWHVDNITHSLFALTLANAGFRRAGRGATAALVIASNIPDIEILTALTGGRVSYLAAHRGPTHGPLGLLLGLAVAAGVWLAGRVRRRRRHTGESCRAASLLALSVAATVGVVGHVAMDLATSYGTRVLSPFRGTWYGVDWMPIVDVYLWAILGAFLTAGALRPALRQRLAVAALLVTAGDYALRAGAHTMALREAVAMEARAVPGSVARADLAFHYLNADDPAPVPAALPTWASPFRWRLITRVPGGFDVRDVDLFGRRNDGEAVQFPNDRGAVVAQAATAHLARVFLDFSRFPAAEAIKHRNGDVTVHWYDLRFAERAVDPGDGRTHTSPFGAWVRLSPDGAVVAEGLGPG
jgi:membrane-bound metal-dependent hydrolase YbcI (DUF457 family)